MTDDESESRASRTTRRGATTAGVAGAATLGSAIGSAGRATLAGTSLHGSTADGDVDLLVPAPAGVVL